MTRIVAMLAWFDEPEELLAQAIRSAAVVADHVVAVDGGYRLRPGAKSSSPWSQVEAIHEAADAVGITSEVTRFGRVWDGQVEKRNYMLERAVRDADWVVPLDADWVFVGDRVTVRNEIEATTAAVLQVPMFTPHDGQPLERVAATDWHASRAGEVETVDVLMRVAPGLRVERHHWCYSGEIGGVRHALWGCEGEYPSAPRQPSTTLMIEHRCFERDLERVAANRDYCAARDAEVMMIGSET